MVYADVTASRIVWDRLMFPRRLVLVSFLIEYTTMATIRNMAVMVCMKKLVGMSIRYICRII